MRGLNFFEGRQPVGHNQGTGVMVFSFFPTPTKGIVALEFLDASGKVMRRYSNEEKKEADTPPEWPDLTPPDEKIPAEMGINRFAWDLRMQGAVPLAVESCGVVRNPGSTGFRTW